MFEAVIALCLEANPDVCRQRLVPGYEANSLAGCVEQLSARPLAGAVCQASGASLAVVEIAPGVFVHEGLVAEPDPINQGDVANLGFIVGDASIAVVDTGSSAALGEALWRAIRARSDKPVSHVVLTHMHPDHVLGMTVFVEAGAQVVGHARLDRALADRRVNYRESLARLIGEAAFIGSDVAPVDIAVEDALELDLGARKLALRAWPVSHTGTDVSVTDMLTGIMFTGDLVFDRHTPALDGSLRGWQAVLAEMRALELTAIVPGHGAPRLDWPKASDAMLRYLDVLASDTRAAIRDGERLGDAVGHIAQSESAHWELFEAYNPRNATVAFTELEWE